MVFYHATYVNRLPSIMREGLKPNAPKNWSFSRDAVYLTSCPQAAFDFAEACDESSDEDYESGIVVLEICDLPNNQFLSIDRNMPYDSSCYEYSGIIPPSFIVKEVSL